MAHDLVIRGGTVVDGTGKPSRVADLAVDGDRVVTVGDVPDAGVTEIDATGRIVTPGFVDIHTHLDAQLGWDPVATSSCWHGVTSVVLGNCGVTFAPVRPTDREYLAELMESVEDIPADSILSGLPWNWETYGEYLRAIDDLPKGVNVGGMVGHCAIRQYVMGERGMSEDPASDDDIAGMSELVDEAMAAGALGFSTSRTFLHRVPDGRPVPGTHADARELLAFADVLARHGAGVFEAAPRLGERDDDELTNSRAEIALLAEIERRSGRPVTFGFGQSDRRPTLYRRMLDFVEELGGPLLRPQTTARSIGVLFGLHHRTPFDSAPSWRELRSMPLEQRLEVIRDPERRAELIADADAAGSAIDASSLFVVSAPDANYDFAPSDSLAAHAETGGESPAATFLRLADESDGAAVVSYPFLNQRMDAVEELLAHPSMLIGLGDSGAHVGQIMDASLPTWFLLHWVRDRGRFSVEEGVRRLTSDTANHFGVRDRGELRPGAFADVNVIHLDGLRLPPPEYVHDFPGGAGRYVQRAEGYDATVVNGEVFMRDGAHAGALAGRTLRSTD